MTSSRLRGATLIEVLVVTTVFSMLLVAIWGIYHSAVRAERLISLKTDIDRVIMTATRHLDSALKSSQLTQPNDWTDPQYVTELELTPLKLGPDGEPQIVNTRIHRNILIVDRLFGAAELRLGGPKRQQVVRIVRTDGRPPQ